MRAVFVASAAVLCMAAIASADVTTEPPDSIGLKKSLFGGTQFVYGEVVEDPFSDDGNVGGFIESLDDEALSAEYMSAEKHYMGGMVLGAISGGLVWLVVIAVLNSVIPAFYYLRVVKVMWLGQAEDSSSVPSSLALRVALLVTCAGVLVLGVVPGSLMRIAEAAAAIFTF